MDACRMSVKRSLRKLNSTELSEAAASEGEYGKLAKAEIERRKRKRERKAV